MADQPSRDERTEEATPRRRQEAREKGQVALSSEFVSAAMLLSGLLFLVLGGRLLLAESAGLVVDGIGSLRVLGLEPLEAHQAGQVLGDAVKRVLPPFLLVIVPTLVVGVMVAFGQTGIGIAGKAVELDLSKIDPVKGLGRMFGLRSVVRTLMSLAKIGVIVLTIVAVAWLQLPRLSALVGVDLGPTVAMLWQLLLRCAIAALVAVLVLGLVDLVYQRFQHDRDLMMTKQEVRDEHKNIDGDPHVKARIRRVQREMAQRRMMQEVPTATVVVTNPTHYAVALRYARDDEGREPERPGRRAPIVVAKGADHVAQRIKEVARAHEVLCFEDVMLARALHARVEIGQEIPEDLYEAVASVLAYVYRVKGAAVPA